MSSNTNTTPRAQRIDSQDEATSGPPVKTDRHSVQEPTQPGTQRDPGPRADTYTPRLKTTRNRLLTITQRFASFRTRQRPHRHARMERREALRDCQQA